MYSICNCKLCICYKRRIVVLPTMQFVPFLVTCSDATEMLPFVTYADYLVWYFTMHNTYMCIHVCTWNYSILWIIAPGKILSYNICKYVLHCFVETFYNDTCKLSCMVVLYNIIWRGVNKLCLHQIYAT